MKRFLIILLAISCITMAGTAGISINASAQSNIIPQWVKSNAKLWADDQISESEFIKGIQYLVEHKIIKISETQQSSQSIQHVPSWVKNLAGMWINGKASNDDFIKAIEYLVNAGIIRVNVQPTLTNTQNQTTVNVQNQTTVNVQNQTTVNVQNQTTVNVQNQTTSTPITSVTTMINQTHNSSTILNSIIPTNNLPSLLGSGINLKIINSTASGFLTLNGKHYDAPNLTIVMKGDEITLTGYVQGSFSVLLMTTGVHTSGIDYNFNGVIMNNGNSVPVIFTASLTNPAPPHITNVMAKQNIQSTPAPGIPMLMLTSNTDRVYMAYPYNLIVKIFDPQSNPQKIFDQFTGGISDVNITATVLDPNNEIVGQSIGKTDSKGIYQDGIVMPYTEYEQEQLQVMINATKTGYATQSTILPLLLIHPNNGGAAPVCSVSTGSLPDGKVGTVYSQTLSSSSCNSPVTWILQSGSLPTGLTLNAIGLIGGTPTALNLVNPNPPPPAIPYSFVVKVTSSDGRVATASLSISIPS